MATEVLVQQQIEQKENEIQALRRQLEEIERLHRRELGNVELGSPFSAQLGSLEQLAKRIPSLFKDGSYRR